MEISSNNKGVFSLSQSPVFEIQDDRITSLQSKYDTLMKMLLSNNGLLLKYIDDPTPEQMEIAVRQNGEAIQYIEPEKRSYELMEMAVESNPCAVKYIGYGGSGKFNLWIKAVSTPYENDGHPIHQLIRDGKYINPILKFLDNNPGCFHYIINDINNHRSAHILWKHILLKYPIDPDTILFNCPIEIQENIIKDVVTEEPCLLLGFDKILWTKEYACKLVDEYPIKVRQIMSWEFMDTNIIKTALNSEKCCGSDVYIIIDAIGDLSEYVLNHEEDKNKLNMFDSLVEYLETKSKYAIITLSRTYSVFSPDASLKDIIEYIFNRFSMEDLVDNIGEECVEILINKPNVFNIFKRIGLKRKMKKIIKSKLKKEKNNDE